MDDAIRAAATDVFWFGEVDARFASPPAGEVDRERTIKIDASLRHGWGLSEAGTMTDGDLVTYWPGNLRQPAAAVFLWVVGDRVTAIDVRPVPSTQTCPSFSMRVSRRFTPAEADRCRVGVAWVFDGKIVAPVPSFTGAGAAQLATALAFDDPRALEQAVAQGASLAAVDSGGMSLFCRAASLGANKVVEQMLRLSPALRDARTPAGKPVLALAAAHGRASVVRAMLKAGVKPKQQGKGSETTPLLFAAANGHMDVVQALAGAGAMINEKIPGGIPSSPMEAAIMAGSEPAVQQLAALGATLPEDPRLARLLVDAAGKGQVDLVDWLVRHSPKSALQRGVDLALAAAARDDSPTLVAILAKAGAKGDVVQGKDSSDQGETALTVASHRGRVKFVTELLACGAAINSRNAENQSALHVAASANQAEVVRLLLERGADSTLVDNARRTPLDLAVLNSSPAAAETLMSRAIPGGSDPVTRERVLEGAIAQDLVGVVVALLGEASKGQRLVIGGWPALALAEACGATKVAAVLREKFGDDGAAPIFAESRALDWPPVLTRSTSLAGTKVLGRRTLRVSVVIDSEGRIRGPRFVERPDVDDSEAILGALAGWRFAPPTRQGQPVATRVVIPLQIGVDDRSFFGIHTVEEPPVLLNGEETMFPDPMGGLSIKVVVNAQGSVQEARVVGPKPEHPCLATIRQWKFAPARHKGNPVTVSMIVHVADVN